MIIKIEKNKEVYRADLKDLPGTPSIGIGKSAEEAVAALFFILLSEGIGWIKHVDFTKFEVVNEP